MADKVRTGGCLCGAVRYEAAEPLTSVVYCHCSQCRRQTGHFMASTNVDLDRFAITDETGLAWYEASDIARRGFCKNCGSTLFLQGHGETYVSIAAGTLDDSTGIEEAGHIFCADKGGYYQITGGKFQRAGGGE
jgi:hypothetical protein